jgi:hypothetical protein
MDSGILCTSEEVILDAKRAWMSELVSTGISISHASLDKAMEEEKELEYARKELASLQHQVQYYQEVRGASNLVKDLLEEHDKHQQIRDTFLKKVVEFQEETLLLSITHKEVLRWRKKGARDLNKVEFIREIRRTKEKKTMALIF